MKIISRAEAKSLNLKFYFTGKPCKHEHTLKRYTGNGNCLGCSDDKNKRTVEYRKQYAILNADRMRQSKKIYNEKNKESIRLRKKEAGILNRESNKTRNKLYYEKNKLRILARVKKYRLDHPEQMAIRDLLKRVISDWRGGRGKCEEILGYTYRELHDHIESLFKPGMSWSNRGEWHIDHIIPVSLLLEYGVTDPAFINGLDNLQPLWAIENRIKGNRFVG
jgi:hypothetical protein